LLKDYKSRKLVIFLVFVQKPKKKKKKKILLALLVVRVRRKKSLTCTASHSPNRAATFCFTTSHDSIDSNSVAMDPAKRSNDSASHSPLVAPPPLPPGAVRLQVLDTFNRYRQVWPAWSATLRPGEPASSLQGVSSDVRKRYVFIWK
jgi:hypothetical protein